MFILYAYNRKIAFERKLSVATMKARARLNRFAKLHKISAINLNKTYCTAKRYLFFYYAFLKRIIYENHFIFISVDVCCVCWLTLKILCMPQRKENVYAVLSTAPNHTIAKHSPR